MSNLNEKKEIRKNEKNGLKRGTCETKEILSDNDLFHASGLAVNSVN